MPNKWGMASHQPGLHGFPRPGACGSGAARSPFDQIAGCWSWTLEGGTATDFEDEDLDIFGPRIGMSWTLRYVGDWIHHLSEIAPTLAVKMWLQIAAHHGFMLKKNRVMMGGLRISEPGWWWLMTLGGSTQWIPVADQRHVPKALTRGQTVIATGTVYCQVRFAAINLCRSLVLKTIVY